MEYTNGITSSFQMRPDSACPIMMTVSMSGGSEKNARAPLVLVDGNINIQRYNSYILKTVAVPYLRGKRDVISQEDNARLSVDHRALAYFDTKGVQTVVLVCTPSRSLQIESIFSWVSKRLSLSTPVTTIDKVWHKFELAWNR
ncbi:hypothetical protein TNCV_2576921 [Trichonephila clavipes]|nr:hypothetical protein TNCV_2576921 [Trichonephila clavipes]